MPDMIKSAMAWLGGKMKRFAAQSVIYTRGADSVTLSATIGPSEIPLEDGTIGVLSYEFRDFQITAADLILGAVQIEPQRGDEIGAEINGVTYTYKVMLEPQNEVWSWVDSSQVRMVVHAKLVS